MAKRKSKLPIVRSAQDGGFVYRDGKKQVTNGREIRRIERIVIPPAWANVRIARASTRTVLAQGMDAAGRTQTIYHETFRRRQDRKKYERLSAFGSALPKLRARVEKDLRRRKPTKERVVACVIRLIDQEFLRVGGAHYAREHGSYGATTLRRKHVETTATSVTFTFIGKSKKSHQITVRDPQIVRTVTELNDAPGHELFRFLDSDGGAHNVDSRHVNAYVKKHMGAQFSAKDFRTWGASLLAFSALLEYDSDSGEERDVAVRRVVSEVAKRLGNTPAVTRESYIAPSVIEEFENGDGFAGLRRSMRRMKPGKHLSVEERCLLKVLAAK